MTFGAIANIASSILVFGLGNWIGLVLRQRGVSPHSLFSRKSPLSLIFLGAYMGAVAIVLHLPQWLFLPLEWRTSTLQMTWVLLRSLLLVMCGAAIAIIGPTSRSQIVAIVLIGCTGWGIFTGVENYLLTPIYRSLGHDIRPQGIVKQTSDSSCAPAALATVLNQWQIETSEPEVAKFAGTSRVGTSTAQLILAAQQFGMDGLDLRPSWETIQRINRPGILSIWSMDGDRRLPHAVALLKMNQNNAVIADPAEGKAFMVERATLEAVWRHEYVPIFRPQDAVLPPQQALHYLSILGYNVASDKTPSFWLGKVVQQSLQKKLYAALHRFQADNPGLPQTGQLDPETVLALTGSFAQHVPTLALENSSNRTMADYHHQGA